MNRQKVLSDTQEYFNKLKFYKNEEIKNIKNLLMENSDFKALENERVLLLKELSKTNNADTLKLQTFNDFDLTVNSIIEKVKSNLSSKCLLCSDIGYINDKKCSCRLNKEKEFAKKYSTINSSFRFEDNKINDISCRQQKTLSIAYEKIKIYCDNFPNDIKLSILIKGSVGTGKSCLTSSIANEIINKGYVVKYLTAFELSQLLLKYHLSSINDKPNTLNELLSCNLLIIDDLGTEPIYNNINSEYLFYIISERFNAKLPIIMSTNLSNETLVSRYGERIISRIVSKTHFAPITLNGDDLRNLK